VNVRYIVNDVDAAIPFYTDMLGFKLEMHPAPGFAACRGGIYSCCSTDPVPVVPDKPCLVGQHPMPGGCNRIQIEVENLEATVEKLKRAREGGSATKS
jgi:catechol 2,3-dioxygenase-like lactoylglutathione lyase family enzyme